MYGFIAWFDEGKYLAWEKKWIVNLEDLINVTEIHVLVSTLTFLYVFDNLNLNSEDVWLKIHP